MISRRRGSAIALNTSEVVVALAMTKIVYSSYRNMSSDQFGTISIRLQKRLAKLKGENQDDWRLQHFTSGVYRATTPDVAFPQEKPHFAALECAEEQ